MTCSCFSVLGTDSSLDETAGLAIFSLGPVVSTDANVSASLHFGLAASARSLMSKRNKLQPLGFNWSDNGLINIGLCKSCLATSTCARNVRSNVLDSNKGVDPCTMEIFRPKLPTGIPNAVLFSRVPKAPHPSCACLPLETPLSLAQPKNWPP